MRINKSHIVLNILWITCYLNNNASKEIDNCLYRNQSLVISLHPSFQPIIEEFKSPFATMSHHKNNIQTKSRIQYNYWWVSSPQTPVTLNMIQSSIFLWLRHDFCTGNYKSSNNTFKRQTRKRIRKKRWSSSVSSSTSWRYCEISHVRSWQLWHIVSFEVVI